MLKKISLIAVVAVSLISCQQEKTAFVNNEKLIEEYQERKDIEAKYKGKVDALAAKKDSIGKALQNEGMALQAKGANMNESQQQALFGPYMQKRQMLQQQIQQEEQVMAKESQSEIDSLLKKIDDNIAAYGKSKGYTYIFGKNKVGSVMYGSEKNDITAAILESLNKSYSESK
ncbi:MAG: OmpH family outer membrane protein [Flavobacteriaceae bacterium]